MKLTDIIQMQKDRSNGIVLSQISIDKLIGHALMREIEVNQEGRMNTIKTLDERIEDAAGASVTVAEQLEMSRAEVAELKQALADKDLALMEQQEIAQAANRQAEEARINPKQRHLYDWLHLVETKIGTPTASAAACVLKDFYEGAEQEAAPQQHAQATQPNSPEFDGIKTVPAQPIAGELPPLSADQIEELMPENEGNLGAYPCDKCGWIQVSAQWLHNFAEAIHQHSGYQCRAAALEVAGKLAHHLTQAHAFVEGAAAFGHGAASGILQAGQDKSTAWDIDQSKADLAAIRELNKTEGA